MVERGRPEVTVPLLASVDPFLVGELLSVITQKWCGYPYLGKISFSSRFVRTDVFEEAMGNASTHLENRSVTTRINFLPVSLLGYGPIKSKAIVSQGVFIFLGRRQSL